VRKDATDCGRDLAFLQRASHRSVPFPDLKARMTVRRSSPARWRAGRGIRVRVFSELLRARGRGTQRHHTLAAVR
jgi:hypothetical protein